VRVTNQGWLRRDGEVLASLEIADGRADRRRGLLGRNGVDGAFLLPGCRSVHTIGMRFPIDVAICRSVGRDQLLVRAVITMRPWRLTRPRSWTGAVIEAEAGAFERWGVARGCELVVERAA
jgi:uncharacterized membrane protein (UPF0127 family)